jgi:malic enzyme
LDHGGQGCTGVGVAEVLEQMVVTPQHVLAKDITGAVGMLRCQLHVGVLAEQVFNWNSVQSVRVPSP